MTTYQFVRGGCARARSAAEPEIRVAVMAEYSVRLENAKGWQRLLIWRVVEREIAWRLNRVAPLHAFY